MAASQHHTEYAPPVIRSPSPTSSIGTSYDEDQTTQAEMDLTCSEFKLMVQEKLELSKPRREETLAEQDPLIQRPETEPDRQALFQKIMQNLRIEIQQLEENDLYEQTLLRGSQVALQRQPITTDIDALMKSMMSPSMTITDVPNSDLPTAGLLGSVIPNFSQASSQLKEKVTLVLGITGGSLLCMKEAEELLKMHWRMR
ncbi:hypothetical protein BDQ17DRAFT_1404738 [Cyathus striatus]|nr:hypothetical protein BDQ17DRAFT_1404738 [Cyathus striatus]